MSCAPNLGLAIAGLVLAACTTATRPGSPGSSGPGEPTLAEVRAATERFRDLKVALAEGYIRDPFDLCETADMTGRPASEGAMGVHYFRPDLLGVTAPPSPRVDGNGTHIDFRQPAILLYEPQADGSMELIAVENLVFRAAWAASGHTAPPSFHGYPTTTWLTIPPRQPTRRTCSCRTSTGTSGSIGTTRLGSSSPSIPRSPASTTRVLAAIPDTSFPGGARKPH